MPKAVVQDRYNRLIALLEEITWAENKKLIGRTAKCWSPPARAARTSTPAG